MLTITLSKAPDLDAIGKRWAEFEPLATGSFFQSWAWVGCLVAERFDAPLLLEARRAGALVGLALFNRRQPGWPVIERLWLNESGRASHDVVFVEHNGLLLARDAGDILTDCLKALLDEGHATVLSGVDAAHMQAAIRAKAVFTSQQCRPSPYVDLMALRRAGADFLSSLSANTRYQLRRSAKAYAAQGALQITRATSEADAHASFDAMGRLHQATWTRRGKPGAFASPHFVHFHHRLIERAYASGAIDLLCVKAGERIVGYLYNLCWQGRISAYQSGFAYSVPSGSAADHRKPGLTCHHLAVEHYLTTDAEAYDFLAGEDRYKTSLANATESLHWLTVVPRGSLLAVVNTARSKIHAALGAGARRAA